MSTRSTYDSSVIPSLRARFSSSTFNPKSIRIESMADLAIGLQPLASICERAPNFGSPKRKTCFRAQDSYCEVASASAQLGINVAERIVQLGAQGIHTHDDDH